jgi:hypothetical protein
VPHLPYFVAYLVCPIIGDSYVQELQMSIIYLNNGQIIFFMKTNEKENLKII